MSDQDVFRAVDELRRSSKAKESDHLFYSEIGTFRRGSSSYSLPRFVFLGPGADYEPLRIGIFAAIHGDEPETAHAALEFLRRLSLDPERARG